MLLIAFWESAVMTVCRIIFLRTFSTLRARASYYKSVEAIRLLKELLLPGVSSLSPEARHLLEGQSEGGRLWSSGDVGRKQSEPVNVL